MSFEYDLKVTLPGKGSGMQEDPCDSGAVHVIAKAIGDTTGVWNGNVFKGRYLTTMVPLYPTSPWSWSGREPVNWDAHWSIRPVHKDVRLQVSVENQGTGTPSARQSFWLRKGVPPAYIYVLTSEGLMGVLMSPTFKYLRDAGILRYDMPRWSYIGTKAGLQKEIDEMPEVVTTIYATDGDLVVNLDQRVLLQEERLTFFNATLGAGNEWTTVGPVNKQVLLEALDGYEPDPEPEPDPDPEPDPEDGIHKRTVDLRMVEGYVTDCGVKVTATEDGITKGKITIYSSAEPISEEGHIEKVVQFSIGKGSALVKMCRANWGVAEADTAIIVADKKFSASAVWLPSKEGENYEYVGVPGIEPL